MPGEKCQFTLRPFSFNFCNVGEFHRQPQVYMFSQLNYITTNPFLSIWFLFSFDLSSWHLYLFWFFSHFCLHAVLYLQCLIESPGLLCVPPDQLYWKIDPYVNHWIYICSHCGSAGGQPFRQCRSPGHSQHLVSAFHFTWFLSQSDFSVALGGWECQGCGASKGSAGYHRRHGWKLKLCQCCCLPLKSRRIQLPLRSF